jgi:uncharacterized protein (DUF433 family)
MVTAVTQQILLVGKGIYSFPRASALTGIPVQNLRRWAVGRPAAADSLSARPIIDLELPDIDDERALSFLNLVELKLVGEFRRLKLPLQYIRRVVDILRDSYNFDHPLACKRLLTDGRSVFAEIDESGEFACVEIAGRRPNHVILEEVVRPYFKDIEFYGQSQLARRWFPAGRRQGIVIDPELAFGEPVLAKSGLETWTLAELVAAGETVRNVASWYEIPPADVEKAVEFERLLTKRVAA